LTVNSSWFLSAVFSKRLAALILIADMWPHVLFKVPAILEATPMKRLIQLTGGQWT
uniref:Uncharacterized protein n=1 Tax=Amphimedon queenslandica TaxID=400682 RepID=A0A1X7VLU4_AMPQE